MNEAPILKLPYFDKFLVVNCDGSQVGTDGILRQDGHLVA